MLAAREMEFVLMQKELGRILIATVSINFRRAGPPCPATSGEPAAAGKPPGHTAACARGRAIVADCDLFVAI